MSTKPPTRIEQPLLSPMKSHKIPLNKHPLFHRSAPAPCAILAPHSIDGSATGVTAGSAEDG